jgi:signal transduction histidine kinase
MHIELSLPSQELSVNCDENAIRSVFRNLGENAIKHAATGRYLHIGAAREQEFAVVRFTDRGCGVPRKERKRIFDAFQRGSAAAENQTEGSGIGLNLSRRIAVLHGGSLVLESSSPHGSVFTVRLPLQRP